MYKDEKPQMELTGSTKVQNGVVERLVNERNQCEKRLKDLNDMIAKLDEEPKIADILNQLSKITHF